MPQSWRSERSPDTGGVRAALGLVPGDRLHSHLSAAGVTAEPLSAADAELAGALRSRPGGGLALALAAEAGRAPVMSLVSVLPGRWGTGCSLGGVRPADCWTNAARLRVVRLGDGAELFDGVIEPVPVDQEVEDLSETAGRSMRTRAARDGANRV